MFVLYNTREMSPGEVQMEPSIRRPKDYVTKKKKSLAHSTAQVKLGDVIIEVSQAEKKSTT